MSKRFSLLVLAFFAIFLLSCETDFNPNAEYKDITIVYGLLNQSDTFTYIKINKAFLGNESAYVMAQNEDLSSYGNDLKVTMEELLDGNVTKIFNFDTTTIYNKEPGIFYAPKQVLYRCKTYTSPQDLLTSDKEYKLIIKNTKTGKIISAKTKLVGKFNIGTPSPWQTTIEFTTTGKSTVEWISATGGKRYQVSMRINYFESLNDTSHFDLNHPKHIDVNLGLQKPKTLEGSIEMSLNYSGLVYYNTLKNNLVWSTNEKPIFRKPGKIEFLISVAGDDLSTYIDVNEVSNSIVQVRPEFTNISNGIGVFSARYNNANKPLDLGSKSREVLKSEQYAMLGFY